MTSLTELCNKYGYYSGINRGMNVINTGGDKAMVGFTEYYDTIFKDKRYTNINMLEIGIFQGRSLAMWCDYFEKGNIYGIDINLKEFELFKPELYKNYNAFVNNDVKQIFEMNCSVNLTKFNELPMFDIILDDGAHDYNSQYNTIKNIWHKLNSNGIYIIEDSAQDSNDRYNNSMRLLNNIKESINSIKQCIVFKSLPRHNKSDKYIIVIWKSNSNEF